MRILVHCNGGPEVGLGHAVRSLALAEEAISGGHDVAFAGRFDGDFLERQVSSSGVEVIPARVEDLADVVRGWQPEVLHVDSYDAPDDLVAIIGVATADRPLVSNVEDAPFGCRDADLTVDPTLDAEADPRPTAGLALRGARFVPLRRLVRDRVEEVTVHDEARRVLVVMGGTDPHGLAPRVARALVGTGLEPEVTVIGAEPVDLPGATVQPPVDDLPGVMAEHDLVVSAAGTSVWELLCLGIPAALLCAADNQRAGYDRLVGRGVVTGLGDATGHLDDGAVTGALRALLLDPVRRRSRAAAGARLIDGLGTWRLVRTWEQLLAGPAARSAEPSRLHLRPAVADDAEMLLRWRNDPQTRAGSRGGTEVAPAEHQAWLEASLGRADRILLVASDTQGDVGTVRWDAAGPADWEVSVTVAPERRGEGLSASLLHAGEQALADARPEARTFLAVVHERNAASVRLFRAAGYTPDLPPDPAGFARLLRQPGRPA